MANDADTVALPLDLPHHAALPSNPKARHYLYIRPHTPKIASNPHQPQDQSLYLSNIPFDTTISHVRAFFAAPQLGNVRITAVDFEDSRPSTKRRDPSSILRKGKSKKRKRGPQQDGEEEAGELDPGWPETWERELHVSGSCAVVNFVDEKSRDVAWRAVRKLVKAGAKDDELLPTWTSTGVTFTTPATNTSSTTANGKSNFKRKTAPSSKARDAPPLLGSARYLHHQKARFPAKPTLQEKADAYLVAFATLETAQNAKRQQLRSQPDEDGFVTVTKGSRTGPVRMEEVQEMEERRKKKLEKGKERWGEGEFYRFQLREKRKAREKELQEEFGKDAQRLGLR
ncbi:MAG: Ribosomal RNA-processing protein 7 [Chrysothrix sp. TS-e1954]|nr:MAG: Ribosomal RNA-processing protein 7 [Chrysothrix sp. TS-e1954]